MLAALQLALRVTMVQISEVKVAIQPVVPILGCQNMDINVSINCLVYKRDKSLLAKELPDVHPQVDTLRISILRSACANHLHLMQW